MEKRDYYDVLGLSRGASDEEIKKRIGKWNPPDIKIKEGYLARYSRLVTSAAKGAVLK